MAFTVAAGRRTTHSSAFSTTKWMEACGNAAALRVPDSLAGVQLMPTSGKAVSGHACPDAPSASTGSCGHEQQHGSPESDSALGPEAVAAADAPGTPPAVAPAPTLCRSLRGAQAPSAAALFGLGACGSGSGVASGQYLPTLVPLRGSAAPRVLLGYGGSAWPALPLGACATASASVQACPRSDFSNRERYSAPFSLVARSLHCIPSVVQAHFAFTLCPITSKLTSGNVGSTRNALTPVA